MVKHKEPVFKWLMSNEITREILQFMCAHPCSLNHRLQRQLGTGPGQLNHYLKRIEMYFEKIDNAYFCKSTFPPTFKGIKRLKYLRTYISLNIHSREDHHLLKFPAYTLSLFKGGKTNNELAAHLGGVNPASISTITKELFENEIIKRKTTKDRNKLDLKHLREISDWHNKDEQIKQFKAQIGGEGYDPTKAETVTPEIVYYEIRKQGGFYSHEFLMEAKEWNKKNNENHQLIVELKKKGYKPVKVRKENLGVNYYRIEQEGNELLLCMNPMLKYLKEAMVL